MLPCFSVQYFMFCVSSYDFSVAVVSILFCACSEPKICGI